MITKNIIFDNVKTIFYALVIAIVIRSLFIQPFYIPSSSMEPTLLIGDRLFVTKYSYGYSKHSFPFSPPLFKKRLFENVPDYGDLVVFKTPTDNRTDYIKRLIGMPGDEIKFQNGNLLLNNNLIPRIKTEVKYKIRCGPLSLNVNAYTETLPNGKNLGIKITYVEQESPKGLPDAFIVGEKFIGKDSVALILGDNFFFGQSLTKKLIKCTSLTNGAKVFLHPVKNPSLYGVATINEKKQIVRFFLELHALGVEVASNGKWYVRREK